MEKEYKEIALKLTKLLANEDVKETLIHFLLVDNIKVVNDWLDAALDFQKSAEKTK